jgi:hypothetical protein
LSQLNIKILLAPLLAIALVLFLAGAINLLMLPTGGDVHLQPTPQSYLGPPTAAASVSDSYSPILFFLFIAGAIMVGLTAVLLFFREKSLSKELSE